MRAKLAKRVENWKWGSGYRRLDGTKKERSILADLPIELPRNYRDWVNHADKEDDLSALRTSAEKGKPLGTMSWMERMVERFGLQATMRAPGRPKKA